MRRTVLAGAFAWVVVRLRWVIVLAWSVAAVASTVLLPSLEDAGSLPASSLLPADSDSLDTTAHAQRLFSVPLTSQIAVVQRDPDGLSAAAQARVARRALAASVREDPDLAGLELALPIANTLGLFPGSRESSTTAITFLIMQPDLSLREQDELAHRFASKYVTEEDDGLTGITGAVPARLQEWREIVHALPWVTAAAVLAIAVILGLYYRAPLAPAVALAAAGIAYLVSKHVVAWLGPHAGFSVPRDAEPVMVALVLGIVTDYAVFFLSATRNRLLDGEGKLDAATRGTAEYLPTVVTAGLIVAAGSAALLAGTLDFFRALGPAMAGTVLISLLVAVTLIPALMGIFGRLLFWPSFERLAHTPRALTRQARSEFWRAFTRVGVSRPIAFVVVLICLGALALASRGLVEINLGITAIGGLPGDSEQRRAARAAGEGFPPGILAPLTVLVEGEGELPREGLERLEASLEDQGGVAAVIGPGDEVARRIPELVVSERAPAVRYLVVFDEDPHGAEAIDDFEALEERMPELVDRAGLSNVQVGFAGETAFAAETVETIVHDLARIGLAALLANFILLALFLRALVAPLYLLVASGLALAASLGLTALVFQEGLGYGELTYFVPFAVAVLLLSLGSDYNIFVVGQIWREAEVRPLRDAVALAAPRASGAINVAALALACSFAALALIPLRSFREFAFAMSVGVLIDVFLVRSVLVPALVSVFGEAGWWPARRRPSAGGESRTHTGLRPEDFKSPASTVPPPRRVRN
jgi:putative drug exporter of the RND superfamily